MAHQLFGQERPEENAIIQPSEKRMNQYVGIQINQLIRNILTFGGTSTPVTNPYLLTYSLNSKATGLGFSMGIGGSSVQTKTTDNFITTTSKVSDYALRGGIEGKKYISRRWMMSFSWDLLTEGNKSVVTSDNGGNGNQTITSKVNKFGTGPRGGLSFQFHEKMLVGTEASYYFKWSDQTTTIKPNNGGGTNPNNSQKLQQFQFSLPAVIFLVMKF
ncbi:MAG: hypothetical protein WDO14_00700 [Bacteroidota bacterium]